MHVYAQIDGKCSLLPETERICGSSSLNDLELINYEKCFLEEVCDIRYIFQIA